MSHAFDFPVLPMVPTGRYVLTMLAVASDKSVTVWDTASGKVVRTFARVKHVETFGDPVVRVKVSSRTGYRQLVAVLTDIRERAAA